MLHFHEWLKVKLKEDNTCHQCGQKFFPDTGVYVENDDGSGFDILHFCSERCTHEFYIDALRAAGI